MLGFYGLFDRAVPYPLGTLHGTPYGLSLPPAGAVSVGTMLAAVDYLIVPSLSGSAQGHAKRPQPGRRDWGRFF